MQAALGPQALKPPLFRKAEADRQRNYMRRELSTARKIDFREQSLPRLAKNPAVLYDKKDKTAEKRNYHDCK